MTWPIDTHVSLFFTMLTERHYDYKLHYNDCLAPKVVVEGVYVLFSNCFVISSQKNINGCYKLNFLSKSNLNLAWYCLKRFIRQHHKDGKSFSHKYRVNDPHLKLNKRRIVALLLNVLLYLSFNGIFITQIFFRISHDLRL